MTANTKRNIAFWIATLLVMVPNLGAGAGYLSGAMDEAMTHLGYPLYFAKMLGVWKILGALTILSPRFAPWMDRLKDFAYAGYGFVLTSAAISHAAVGDPVGQILPPLVMLGFLVASFALRPKGGRSLEQGPTG